MVKVLVNEFGVFSDEEELLADTNNFGFLACLCAYLVTDSMCRRGFGLSRLHFGCVEKPANAVVVLTLILGAWVGESLDCDETVPGNSTHEDKTSIPIYFFKTEAALLMARRTSPRPGPPGVPGRTPRTRATETASGFVKVKRWLVRVWNRSVGIVMKCEGKKVVDLDWVLRLIFGLFCDLGTTFLDDRGNQIE